MSRKDLALEHKVIQPLKAHSRLKRRWLLAVSGGVDSMVLCEVLLRWRQYLGVELGIAHVHHGTKTGAVQRRFRNLAQRRVREWCRAHKVDFHTNRAMPSELHSEEELRAFRDEHLRAWMTRGKYDILVFAHHRDDLLETRLLRLIRGTGARGLRGMRLLSGGKLRPLLELSRAEIESYARARGLEWCEDPSNAEERPLRNWLRHTWIPELERRQAGASKALARSLEVLAEPPTHEENSGLRTYVGLRRAAIREASSVQRRILVADYLRGLGLKNYGRSHVHEILKRLSTRRKNLKFQMLGMQFEVTPDLLWASRV